MPPVATGLIGYGTAGRLFHAPLIQAEPGLRLAAISSSRHAAIRQALPGVAVHPRAQDLIDHPDLELLVIASPNASHFPLAAAALAAGKHVVIDKPFTLDVAEADALIQRARDQRRVLSVFHNRRWDGDFLTVRRVIAAGTLGVIHQFERHYDRWRPEIRSGWREVPAAGAGVLNDLGSHLLDQALCLFGPPESLNADVLTQRRGARVDDYFHLVLSYGSCRVILHASSLTRTPGPTFVVHGDRGSLVKHGFDRQEVALAAGLRPGTPGWGEDDPAAYATVDDGNGPRRLPTLPGAYPAYYRGIAEAVRDGRPPPVTATQARAVMQLLAIARQSAQTGCTVPVPAADA